MNASEFAFLALGLVLGLVSGAALVEVFRSRPPAPREVRLVVAPDSVPRRRSVTLSEDAFVQPGPEPAHGGPADRRRLDRTAEPWTANTRAASGTGVRSPLPPAGAGDLASSPPLAGPTAPRRVPEQGARALPFPTAQLTHPPDDPGPGVAIPIHHEPDPTLASLRASISRASTTEAAPAPRTAPAGRTRRGHAATAVVERAVGTAAPPAAAPRTARRRTRVAPAADDPAPDGRRPGDGERAAADDACTEVRRVADERCAVARRARERADVAHSALRAAQRAHDEQLAVAEQASLVADPRAIRTAKDAAQERFREARAGAVSAEALEAAASHWLDEVNRIDQAARDAAASGQRGEAAAASLRPAIQRLTVEADTARISAETADATCVAARQEVADCHGAADRDPARTGPWAAQPSVGSVGLPDRREGDDASALEAALSAAGPGEPAILRVLRGDRAAMSRIVEGLAGDDPAGRTHWQRAISALIDAILARSIEAAVLTFPLVHSFWGAFSLGQSRDIVAALSSLGYRFDGLGGWLDDRIPSQGDLSLAIGYAGLDPMRMRHWPSEAEMRELFAQVEVAADQYLAGAAGGLTLGELVSLLGRRADALPELWNEWARVRPLLLAGA